MATAGTITRRDIDNAEAERRSIETQFILDETRGEGKNGESYVFLSITTYHNRDRKAYRTSITRIFRDGFVNRMAFSLDMYEDRQPVADMVQAVARHSVKALRAAHEEALKFYTQQANFDALIDWAGRTQTRD